MSLVDHGHIPIAVDVNALYQSKVDVNALYLSKVEGNPRHTVTSTGATTQEPSTTLCFVTCPSNDHLYLTDPVLPPTSSDRQ